MCYADNSDSIGGGNLDDTVDTDDIFNDNTGMF